MQTLAYAPVVRRRRWDHSLLGRTASGVSLIALAALAAMLGFSKFINREGWGAAVGCTLIIGTISGAVLGLGAAAGGLVAGRRPARSSILALLVCGLIFGAVWYLSARGR